MSYHELTFSQIVCCPVTETKLVELEPWLNTDENGEFLYPTLCGTTVLQPHIDGYLQNEASSILRACAEFGDQGEALHWFLSRYDKFNPDPPSPMDTEILGEGYAGFWADLDLPPFVRDMCMRTPESILLEIVGDHHPALGLDLGCGQGGMTQAMAASCHYVLGLERNFYLAAVANQLLKRDEIRISYRDPLKGRRWASLTKKPRHNARVICGDIEAMPFNEPLFDWVHCGHVLDLVDDPVSTLVHIQKIMKPGATLSICSPLDLAPAHRFGLVHELLSQNFQVIEQLDGLPWLRLIHKRKFVLHEDWLWVGKLKTQGS